MRFRVEFYREWKETGSAEVEADDEDHARDVARTMLLDNDDAIEWEGSNMEIQQQDVEGVVELEDR